MVVVVGWGREGQGQGLLLLPGKTLPARANGFQTQGLEAHSLGALRPAGLDLAQPLEERQAEALCPRFYPPLTSLSVPDAALSKSLYLCMPPFPRLSNERRLMSERGWSSVCSKATSSGKPFLTAPGRRC